MLNKVIIMGRLTRPPELKKTQSGTSVLSFSIACDRDYADDQGNRECDFINCTAWRSTAEFISKYFDKGSMIVVSGRMQTRSYDKDGEKRTATEVVVDTCYFGESRRSSERTSESVSEQSGNHPSADNKYLPNTATGSANAPQAHYEQVRFVEVDEEGLPF